MSSYLNEFGPKLIENDYLVVPIAKGQKFPSIKGWQVARLTADDCGLYGEAGIGFLCGVGPYPLRAIDVDCLNEGLVTAFTDWVQAKFDITLIRVGRAPKTLLVYRAEKENVKKKTSAMYENKQRLEVLGAGQQFVGFGIHPVTNQPYRWEGLLGDPFNTPARKLTVITESQIDDIINQFEILAEKYGLRKIEDVSNGKAQIVVVDDDPLETEGVKIEDYTLEDAERDMSVISSEPRDLWIAVGMALHFQFDASDKAYEKWDEWSSTASTYKGPDDTRYTWDSFGKRSGRKRDARTLKKLAKKAREQAEIAQKIEMLKQAREMIEACDDEYALRFSTVEKVLAMAGDDDDLVDILVHDIQARGKKLGTSISKAEILKKRKKTSRANGGDELTDAGNANRMARRYEGQLLYWGLNKQWYEYESNRWRQVSDVEVQSLMADVIVDILAEIKEEPDADKRDALYDFYMKSRGTPNLVNAEKAARVHKAFLVHDPMFDEATNLIGFKNGVLDVHTLELMAHTPDYRLTKQIAVDYNPEAKCPLFEQTVSEVFFGDQSLIDYFQKVLGRSLLGESKEQELYILHGNGANGKSTVVNAVMYALGPYAKEARGETFASGLFASSASNARPDLVALKGARLVSTQETGEGATLVEALIKLITGGEKMPVRDLYKGMEEVSTGFVILLSTNHKPKIRGADFGIWRRIRVIPFSRNFLKDPDVKVDKDLPVKLRAEAEGIIAWLLKGMVMYQIEGIDELPVKVQKEIEDYKSDMDLIGQFVDECCEVGENYQCSVDVLFAHWRRSAEASGYNKFINDKRGFSNLLAEKGFERIRFYDNGKQVRGFKGIRPCGYFDEVKDSVEV